MRRLIAVLVMAALPTMAAADTGPGLFLDGLGATALVAGGGVEVPARQFACAGCHGEDARGGREGATVFPALIEGTTPRFDRATLAAAVLDGVGSDGRKLAASMPRYRIDPTTLDALHDFLSALAAAGRVGVEARSLQIALPTDAALRGPFAEAIEEANRAGGAWGRMFRFTEAPADALVTGDEAVMRLEKALVEEIAASVVAELTRRGVGAIGLDGEDKDFAAALIQNGAELDPKAAFRVEPVQSGARLTDAEGRSSLVQFAGQETLNRSPLTPKAMAYLAAREVVDATMACGRDVTRRCVIDRLGTTFRRIF